MMWPTAQCSQHHHVQGSILDLHVTSRTGCKIIHTSKHTLMLQQLQHMKICVQAFVKQLHSNNQYWVPIVDPGIKVDPGYPAYDQGLAAKAFINDFTGKPYLGQAGLPSLLSLLIPSHLCKVACLCCKFALGWCLNASLC